jgi:(p)ppGpp synthase/HD superfamily hydrolase
MDTVQITLPDGATREVPRGTTSAQIAHQISPRLAKEALVARADGELVDLSRPLEQDAKLSILTAKDPRRGAGLPPLGRAFAGCGGAGAVSQRKARHRPAYR